MKIRLYNTLTKKLQTFKSLKFGKVGIYSCGPTVYWNQHIGHMYAYIHWDTLVRFLRYQGFQVKWAMNITDVGHMTSDADIGEHQLAFRAIKVRLEQIDQAGVFQECSQPQECPVVRKPGQ